MNMSTFDIDEYQFYMNISRSGKERNVYQEYTNSSSSLYGACVTKPSSAIARFQLIVPVS